MNMRNNTGKFFSAALTLLLLFAAVLLPAQQRQKRVMVPEEVLAPPYNETFVLDKIKTFTDWATAKYRKDPANNTNVRKKAKEGELAEGKEYVISSIEFRKHFFPYETLFMNDISKDDLQEVTRHELDWYINLGRAGMQIKQAVSILDKARFSGNKDYFDKAFDNFEKTVDKYKDCLRAKKKIIPREKYRELVKKNRQRRGQAWLAAEKLKQQSSAAGEKDK